LKFSRLHLLLIGTFIQGIFLSVLAIGLKPPEQPKGVVPLFPREYPGLSRYFSDSTLFKVQLSRFKREVVLDTARQTFRIRDLLDNKDYELPAVVDLDYYSHEKVSFDDRETWNKTVLKNLGKESTSSVGGIELNIPVKIKSKAFKRIFGGDRVGLRVTGNISFELAGRSESREGSAVSSYEQRGNFSPRFKQTQQFQVEGKVGDKVSVKVDQNSEATFDFENTLRLTYTGDEDEIIQSIEAGNVSLSLPSTNYVSASSKSQGLFGLKTAMQVGNLSFTGIASLQRGEKSKLTKTGGAAENTFRIKDIEYVRERFFFVDDYYADEYERAYKPETMTWIMKDTGMRIKQLDVWVSANPNRPLTREGLAVLDPDSVDPGEIDSLQVISGEQERGYFRLLDESEYAYDEYRGYFWLNQTVMDNDVVAVSYVTDNGIQKGQLFNDVTDTSAVVLLKLVRAQGSNSNYPTWKLTMRNVYNLGASGISQDGFDVNILYTKTGQDVDVQPVGDPKPFIYLMGLDRLDQQGSPVVGGDKQIDVRNGNIFNLADGYLIFPSTIPFAPPVDSNFPIDTSLYVNIYNTKDRSIELDQSKFTLEVTTSSVSSNFNLGFNILEGSEIVKLNGRELQKDKDYTIDYFGGTLQILAPEARRADANVEIEYERGSLFQLDKKTLLGGRTEYSFGDRGFIGLTGLYLSKSTLDQRIRLGQEPVRNFIWDLNTSLNFQPNFITKFLDLLPVVETSAESKLRVEAEYAEVNPNPNTFNEKDLGENSGVAYIDDFEGSQRITPLGITYRAWSGASVPERFRILRLGVDFTVNPGDAEAMYAMDNNHLHMFWYNPYNQVPIKDIWPNKDVNAQTGTTTNVLVLEWKNDSIPDSLAWAGIMRSTVNFPDQKKTKFIELWIKGTIGQVNIDIGKISEDYYIRRGTSAAQNRPSLGNLNTEDRNLNGLLDQDEDVGLDGIPASQPNADPYDIWAAPQNSNPPFSQIDGTEGNGEAQGAKYPDTEDLDGSGSLNYPNDYFTYSFDLSDSLNPYINGSTSKGWKLYRIPIRAYDPQLVVGKPDTSFQEIYYARFWLNDLPQDGLPHAISIATFDFVGNEWEESGVAASQDSPFVIDDSLFSITVYNTEENAEPPQSYTPPPGVSGIQDRITKAVSKEQSLVMLLRKLDPGARAEANKQLYEPMNLINYQKLKLFVHGDPKLPGQQSSLQFYMRFGPAKGIYYEVGGKVYPGWDERNFLEVTLDDLAKTKDDQFFQGDSATGFYYRVNPANPEQYFKVVGAPNLRNINFMVIGARNNDEFPLEDYEIWIDELRVTDVFRDKGSAMRLMTDLTFADVGTFRAQWEVVDADFRRIEDQFGSGNTTERQDYRMSLRLNKFLPSSWGFSIPLSGSYVKSRNIPKYFYNTDQLTKYKSTGLTQKFEQFFGLSSLSPELERNSRISETKSFGATISRQGNQRTPWFLKYSLDMLTLDMDWSQREGSDERNDVNRGRNISGQLQLRVPFSRDNSFQPFGWLGNGPVVRLLSREKMYYTPSSFDASVAIRDNESGRKARLENEITNTVQTTASRRFAIGYNLFHSVSVNFGRDFSSDGQLKGYRAKELVEAIFTKFDFGVDKVMNQNFGVNYNPRWFSWMTQTFKYSSGFNYNYSNVKTNDRSSNLQVNKGLNVNLQPSMLANKIYDPRRAQLQSRGSPSPPPQLGGPEGSQNKPGGDEESSGDQQQDQGKKQQKSGKKAAVPSLNPLKLVWKFFNAWKSVGIDYQLRDSYSYFSIEDIPTFKHQLGFSSDPGVGTDTTFGKIERLPAIKHSKSINGNLNFDIIQNLTSSFKYNYAKDQSDNNQLKTENISNTYFYMGDDPENNKKVWYQFIPDWQFRLSGLEKLFFLKDYVNSVQLEHARNGKTNETNRFDGGIKTKTNWGFSNNYSPFLGINLTTKWGISGNARYTRSSTYSYSVTGGDNKSIRSGFDVTFSFSKSTGFSLPLPFLKNKKLKNEMQLNLTISKVNDVSFARRAGFGSNEFIEQDKNSSFKFKPSTTYRFSQKVNGSMFFEYSSSQTKRTGKYSYFEFGINVNIAIR